MSGLKPFAVFGFMADPPHISHVLFVEALLTCGLFAKVIVVPSGARADKPYAVGSWHRWQMTNCAFEKLKEKWKTMLHISRYDVFRENATTTIELLPALRKKFKTNRDIYFALGGDLVIPKVEWNQSNVIEHFWDRGKVLLSREKFVVSPRAGFTHPRDLNLPKNFIILDTDFPDISSTRVRDCLRESSALDLVDMLGVEVAGYIDRHHLYKKER